MSRNGPLALIFHTLFVVFMLAPIVVVCLVAFTPEGYLSLPTNGFSLRWFRAIADYPEFVHAFWVSLVAGCAVLAGSAAVRGAGGACHRAPSVSVAARPSRRCSCRR